ncbi:hypothetical protein TNCT_86531 [Trichonephila clavata]|uniref:Uncharacterized protein n=1 Tax=Trichonephila clavata TaxID=2740835 RepID=A0A8X6HGI6_TRICU|nr:hypothetical protein TNCT_86531 [Trichonephila clavata]
MDDKIKKHCQPVCSDAIDHKKVNDEDGHVRDFANLPFPPSDGTEGHSKFYSKDPFTLSDDDSETEYKNFEKENIEGDVKKRIKNDHVLENEGHVEEKREVESSKDISDDDESYDINNNLNMFSKNYESNDDDKVQAFPETVSRKFLTLCKKCIFTYHFIRTSTFE